MAVDIAEVVAGSAGVEPGSPGTSLPQASEPTSPQVTWDPAPEDVADTQETQPVSPVVETPADPVPPTPEPFVMPDLAAMTPEARADFIQTIPPDEITKHPEVQKHIQRAMQREQDRVREEAAQTDKINQTYLGWRNYFMARQQDGTIGQVLATDRTANEMWWKTQEWEKAGGVINAQGMTAARHAQGSEIMKNVRSYVEANAALKTVVTDWDEITTSTKDPAEFIVKLAEKAVASERAKIKTEIEAGVAALAAQRHLTLPTSPSVNSAPVATTKLTPQEYERQLLAGEITEDGPEARAFWADN